MIDHLSCDLCGDDLAQLREIDLNGWTANLIVCRVCFEADDKENEFKDLKLAQEARE